MTEHSGTCSKKGRGREERALARARKAELAAFRAPLYDADGEHIGWIRMRLAPDRAPRPKGVAFGHARGVGEAFAVAAG